MNSASRARRAFIRPMTLSLGFNPRSAQAGGIGFVPEDRKRQCILLGRSVAENFALPWVRELSAYCPACARCGTARRAHPKLASPSACHAQQFHPTKSD
jgi:ABC-type sugar transport system ATPase subunit